MQKEGNISQKGKTHEERHKATRKMQHGETKRSDPNQGAENSQAKEQDPHMNSNNQLRESKRPTETKIKKYDEVIPACGK